MTEQTDTGWDSDKIARKVTDAFIERLEIKVRAGEWVSINAVRRELYPIITAYERRLEVWDILYGDEEE
tara:strand:+ start:306 stop:512 length:207 start_codon:yes stop_codon:yes gene_type:complete